MQERAMVSDDVEQFLQFLDSASAQLTWLLNGGTDQQPDSAPILQLSRLTCSNNYSSSGHRLQQHNRTTNSNTNPASKKRHRHELKRKARSTRSARKSFVKRVPQESNVFNHQQHHPSQQDSQQQQHHRHNQFEQRLQHQTDATNQNQHSNDSPVTAAAAVAQSNHVSIEQHILYNQHHHHHIHYWDSQQPQQFLHQHIDHQSSHPVANYDSHHQHLRLDGYTANLDDAYQHRVAAVAINNYPPPYQHHELHSHQHQLLHHCQQQQADEHDSFRADAYRSAAHEGGMQSSLDESGSLTGREFSIPTSQLYQIVYTHSNQSPVAATAAAATEPPQNQQQLSIEPFVQQHQHQPHHQQHHQHQHHQHHHQQPQQQQHQTDNVHSLHQSTLKSIDQAFIDATESCRASSFAVTGSAVGVPPSGAIQPVYGHHTGSFGQSSSRPSSAVGGESGVIIRDINLGAASWGSPYEDLYCNRESSAAANRNPFLDQTLSCQPTPDHSRQQQHHQSIDAANQVVVQQSPLVDQHSNQMALQGQDSNQQQEQQHLCIGLSSAVEPLVDGCDEQSSSIEEHHHQQQQRHSQTSRADSNNAYADDGQQQKHLRHLTPLSGHKSATTDHQTSCDATPPTTDQRTNTAAQDFDNRQQQLLSHDHALHNGRHHQHQSHHQSQQPQLLSLQPDQHTNHSQQAQHNQHHLLSVPQTLHTYYQSPSADYDVASFSLSRFGGATSEGHHLHHHLNSSDVASNHGSIHSLVTQHAFNQSHQALHYEHH